MEHPRLYNEAIAMSCVLSVEKVIIISEPACTWDIGPALKQCVANVRDIAPTLGNGAAV